MGSERQHSPISVFSLQPGAPSFRRRTSSGRGLRITTVQWLREQLSILLSNQLCESFCFETTTDSVRFWDFHSRFVNFDDEISM
jgi:hypothetical protein